MNLLKDIRSSYGLSYLLIAHNLATVRYMSHAVAMMYLGRSSSMPRATSYSRSRSTRTPSADVGGAPAHPDEVVEEIVLSGEMPSPVNPPSGCHFHPRCPAAMEICRNVAPPVIHIGVAQHQVSCHLYDDVAAAAPAVSCELCSVWTWQSRDSRYPAPTLVMF